MKRKHIPGNMPSIATAACAWPRAMGDGLWLRAAGVLLLAGMLALASPVHAAKRATTDSASTQGFAFTDTRGGRVRLSDYRGKWVLVNFWAPWCPLCRMEVPHLNHLENSRDIAVVGVAMDYGPDSGNALEMAKSMKFVNVLGGNRRDESNAAAQVGPVHFYPMSYLYDPRGEQVARFAGPVNEGRIRKAMQEAASGR